MDALRDCARDARDARSASSVEQILQQLWVELDEDDDWKPYYCTLSAVKGLAFFVEKEDAQNNPDHPLKRLGLDVVKSASRARGIDFYDGVIDVEVWADNPYGADMVRIRPSGLAAMHNLVRPDL